MEIMSCMSIHALRLEQLIPILRMYGIKGCTK